MLSFTPCVPPLQLFRIRDPRGNADFSSLPSAIWKGLDLLVPSGSQSQQELV
ncbi:uncharacterized protein PHALS_12425 [Plasmopara halstedii]|uniref:Uncharacterized protein n=1 Tax=Plasmopara halstedii TaxID=4781 RepID=A0A0N7L5Q4_PLAHL|nr:uncharacterized protein PHALS_12425 [Plasmopara halstedii]CEG42123.1 hypothetical protein PHALS_12425 [Plasmopara halstedii]|eukprot:XP_024578492.1 hypothetical protein PHALS_12425 [Plasmopara halstedii]